MRRRIFREEAPDRLGIREAGRVGTGGLSCGALKRCESSLNRVEPKLADAVVQGLISWSWKRRSKLVAAQPREPPDERRVILRPESEKRLAIEIGAALDQHDIANHRGRDYTAR